MTAHTIGTCYEQRTANFDGQKIVTGTFTGATAYALGGSVLDLSDYFSDEVRGAHICDDAGEWVGLYVNATSNDPATGTVMVKGVSWDDVTIAHNHAACNAAGTTDAADFWLQPANSVLLGVRTTLVAKFAATSLSALTIEVGDTAAADPNAFYAGSADMFADTVGDVTTGPGVEIGNTHGTRAAYLTTAAQRKLAVTATGADLDTTTAGSFVLRMYFSPLTEQGYAPYGMAEVHSGQVLSGSTFNFMAWGTDA